MLEIDSKRMTIQIQYIRNNVKHGNHWNPSKSFQILTFQMFTYFCWVQSRFRNSGPALPTIIESLKKSSANDSGLGKRLKTSCKIPQTSNLRCFHLVRLNKGTPLHSSCIGTCSKQVLLSIITRHDHILRHELNVFSYLPVTQIGNEKNSFAILASGIVPRFL